jgi:hypothetical protein
MANGLGKWDVVGVFKHPGLLADFTASKWVRKLTCLTQSSRQRQLRGISSIFNIGRVGRSYMVLVSTHGNHGEVTKGEHAV